MKHIHRDSDTDNKTQNQHKTTKTGHAQPDSVFNTPRILMSYYRESNDKRLSGNLFSEQKKSKKIIKPLDFGDFQTPVDLTDKICQLLASFNIKPDCILEPTCGKGNFVASALKNFNSIDFIYGVDIQESYEQAFYTNILKTIHTRQKIEKDLSIEFHNSNIFTHSYSEEFIRHITQKNRYLLILGNPPWVTNSALSLIDSSNLPAKSNFKHMSGIEALTGKSNFDISEAIILNLLKAFDGFNGSLALLCKDSTIKNIYNDIQKSHLKERSLKIFNINAKKEFNVNTSASLMLINLRADNNNSASVHSIYNPNKLIHKYGRIKEKFVSDISLYEKYSYLDGTSQYTWRQGIKHDASKVIVLKKDNRGYLNNLNELVSVEEDLLYPFIRGSDLKQKIISQTSHKIILTQTSTGQDISYIKQYPQTWSYLESHKNYFDRRKSKIYSNKNPFAIFGIGEYSFKPYKVAVAGFYKDFRCSLIMPIDEKPVMLDDTVYYISFDSLKDAQYVFSQLQKKEVFNFLSSITFLSAKRPFTKEVLDRINFDKL